MLRCIFICTSFLAKEGHIQNGEGFFFLGLMCEVLSGFRKGFFTFPEIIVEVGIILDVLGIEDVATLKSAILKYL